MKEITLIIPRNHVDDFNDDDLGHAGAVEWWFTEIHRRQPATPALGGGTIPALYVPKGLMTVLVQDDSKLEAVLAWLRRKLEGCVDSFVVKEGTRELVR